MRGIPRFADPEPYPLKIALQRPIDALGIQNYRRIATPEDTTMMQPAFKGLLIAAFLSVLPFAGALADAPSKDEVVAVVKKAVEFYKVNGRDKALVEFNKKDGLFAKGEDYVDVHDINGVCVAHPISPAKVGLNRMDQSDSAGKFYVKDLVDAAKQKPSGWIEYVMKNPTSGKLQNKTAYWEMHDGLIFKAGTYTE
jgi:cytochrome c